MGMYAENMYNLTIPLSSVEAIFTEYAPEAYVWHPTTPTRQPVTPSVENLVRVIAEEFGCDDDAPDYTEDGTTIHIDGWSYGKVHDNEALAAVLAAHGATGIVSGELEGEHFLLEFADGIVTPHAGQVVFPTYKGTLLG